MATLAKRAAGDVVGTYTLTRAFEEGPARATWEADGAVVVTFFAVDEADRERWVTSLQASADVKTGHLPDVLDAGDAADGVWIATRLIHGQGMREVLATVPAPLPDWDEMVSQLAHALGEIHQAGIAHGVVHPGALVLAAEPPPLTVILHDLGAPRTSVTEPYLAPEAIADAELRTPTSDVWSLGIVAFELLTGKRYFEGEGEALRSAIAAGANESASVRAKAVGASAPPKRFDAFFAKCTAKNPTDRFPNGAAALEGAADLLTDESALSAVVEEAAPAKPPPLPLPVRMIKENPKQSIGLAVVLVGAALAAGIFLGKEAGPQGVDKSAPMAKAMAFTRGSPDDAKKACDGGDPAACHGYGLMLAEGTKVPKDEAAAAKLFQKACDAGDLAACGSYATRLAGGTGPDDRAKAAALYRRACDGGELASCIDLAQMLETGAGVPKDEAGARALLKKACDGGLKEACPEK